MQEFTHLRRVYWGGYLAVSSGNIIDEMIQKYIDEQEGQQMADDRQFPIDSYATYWLLADRLSWLLIMIVKKYIISSMTEEVGINIQSQKHIPKLEHPSSSERLQNFEQAAAIKELTHVLSEPTPSTLPDTLPIPDNPSNFYFNEKGCGTQMVGMNDPRGNISADLGETKRSATYGLNYCTAVAFTVTDTAGKRYGHIQHYDPTERTTGAQVLSEARHSVDPENERSIQAVIMSPGMYYEIPWDERKTVILKPEYLHLPEENQQIQSDDRESVELLMATLNAKDDIRIYLYDPAADHTYYQGTLLLDLMADGQQAIYAEGTRVAFNI